MGNTEKANDTMIENLEGSEKNVTIESNLTYDERINCFTPEEQKKIIRRIDIRLTALLGLMYCWVDLIALRLILGIFEAGFFPGCAYLLSCWYPRYELQKRNALFYLIGSMASAFSGIVAYGFSQLKNHGYGPAWWGQLVVPTTAHPEIETHRMPGIAGWRWIFILQGALTCLVALISYLYVADFPERATRGIVKFLNQKESDFVVARIEMDRHDAIAEKFDWVKYLQNALDLKVWGFAALFGLTTTSTYAIAYFLPIILNEGMGFNVAASQCLVAPPYVAAAIVMFLFAWYADKWHVRSPFIIFNGALNLLGIGMLGYVENVGVRYFGVFLATIACNANVPCVLTWQANNIRGQWKRALCSATLVSFGGIGGIVGGTVFRKQDSPEYRPGIWTTMISSALIIIITLLMVFKFHRANRRVDAGGKPIENLEYFAYTCGIIRDRRKEQIDEQMDLLTLYANDPNIPHDDQKASIVNVNATFIAVTDSVIVLRLLARWLIVERVAVDDYFMALAGLFTTALSTSSIVGTHYGLGRHIYDLPVATLVPSLKKVLQILWTCQFIYATSLLLVKLSIISSYLRIFPTRYIRLTMYIMASFIVAVWLVQIFCNIFQCNPIKGTWDFEVKGTKCISFVRVYYFSSSFSILTDLLLCILPLPQAAVTIVKFCGDVRTVDVRTVDARIGRFYDEVIALHSTYEGLSKSLETPIPLEAARVASKTPDGAQLWDQVQIALDDSLRTVNRINQVLDKISKKAGFARKVKTVLEENLRDGELYRLRQRVQFINVTISLPIQMMGLILQLEQRNITTEHQRSLESKFMSLEREMRNLANHPDRVSIKTIPEWTPCPEAPGDSQRNIDQASPSSEAPIEGRRAPNTSAKVAYRVTQEHLKLGREKAGKNDHESAEKFFKKALQWQAKHDFSGRIGLQPAEVVLLLSKSCLEQKKYDEAIKLLSPVAERQADIIPQSALPASTDTPTPISTSPGSQVPDSLQALAARHLLGEAYKLKGEFKSAKEHALAAFLGRTEKLGEHDQKTHESVMLVIEIFQLMGDEEEAEAHQVFLRPRTVNQTSSVSSDVPSSEEPGFNDGRTPEPSTVPTTSDVVNSPIPRQRKSNRPSITRRFMNITRPSQTAPHQPTSDHDIHRLSFSRVGTHESTIPDTSLDSRRSQHVSSPSDTSRERINSVGKGYCSAPRSSGVEGSTSVALLEPKFLAIEQLCDSEKYDQAVKIALKLLEAYHGSNFIIRKDELEKNIRKGDGKGLASTGKGYSPLHYMCELKQEHTDEVFLMLKYGANVNAEAGKAGYGMKSNEVLTPLQLAIDRGHTGISQLLLETPGIRTDIHNGEHWYPLLKAGRKRQYDIVKLVLKQGPSSIPETYPQDYYGCSPLHDAAKRCDLSLVEIFLDHGHLDRLNVNVQDKFGKTALMHAVIKSDVSNPEEKAQMTRQRREVIEALLHAGSDIQILDYTVKDIAESVGIINLNKEVQYSLCRDVEYRTTQVLEQAIKFMRHARRTVLWSQDISQALRVLDCEPLYGYETTRPLKYGEASLGPGQPLFYVEDEEMDFEKLINAPLPKVPREISFTAHWLAVEGVQPSIPQNPTSTTLSARTDSLLPKGPHVPSALAAMSSTSDIAPSSTTAALPSSGAAGGVTTTKPQVKHILSKELQLYFERVTASVLDETQPELRTAGLSSLREDPGLHQLVPYFVQFVAEKVTHNLKDLFVLTQMMHVIEALSRNRQLNLTPYVASLVPPVLTCLIGRHLGTRNGSLDHFDLRGLAASLLKHLCDKYAKFSHGLKPRLARSCLKTFLDPTKPFGAHYGALLGLKAVGGAEVVRKLVVPNLKDFGDDLLKEALKPGSPNTAEAERVLSAIANALQSLVEEDGTLINGINGHGQNGVSGDGQAEMRAKLVDKVGDAIGNRIADSGRTDLMKALLESDLEL
ncbi:hypothetical protein DV737_g1279, partial [Chaetothyriales sp. CBS 132003]